MLLFRMMDCQDVLSLVLFLSTVFCFWCRSTIPGFPCLCAFRVVLLLRRFRRSMNLILFVFLVGLSAGFRLCLPPGTRGRVVVPMLVAGRCILGTFLVDCLGGWVCLASRSGRGWCTIGRFLWTLVGMPSFGGVECKASASCMISPPYFVLLTLCGCQYPSFSIDMVSWSVRYHALQMLSWWLGYHLPIG